MADIYVIDDQHPEDLAMLQALYSRSPASVVTHLEKLKASGSGKFMAQYYVGYGHASIGDCGATTVFIEQVSMLVAKAIQDNPLYNGQEASTRYLDFSQQAVVDPYNSPASTAIQAKWMDIYNRTLPLLVRGLQKEYPYTATEYRSEKVWSNALNARAFDIARALLPLGTTTLLSWSTSLRSARDNLRRLKYHPLPEVRQSAKAIFKSLTEKYPHSFNGTELDASESARDVYAQMVAPRTHFESVDDIKRQFKLTSPEWQDILAGDIVARTSTLDLEGLGACEEQTLAARPENAQLPWRLESYGRYNFAFLLDFGSFRDLQRHRNGICQIPLIDGRFGLNPWYLEQCAAHLSEQENKELMSEIAAQFDAIKNLSTSGIETTPLLDQYFYPMGTQTLVHTAYSVPETLYIGELRSAKTVHASLRLIAQKMLEIVKKDLPAAAVYGDYDQDSWSAKRGEQTISSKVA